MLKIIFDKIIAKIFDIFNPDGFAPVHPMWLEFLYLSNDPYRAKKFPNEKRRIQLTVDFAKKNEQKFETLLEIGCGEGTMTAFLREQYSCPITSIDVCAQALRKAKKNVQGVNFIQTDALTFLAHCKNESFDLVFACEVVYHMNDIAKFIDEITRVSKRRIMSFHYRAQERVLPHLTQFSHAQWTSLSTTDQRGWKIYTW